VKDDSPAAPEKAATPPPSPEQTPVAEPVGAAQEAEDAGGAPSADAAGPGTEAEPSQA